MSERKGIIPDTADRTSGSKTNDDSRVGRRAYLKLLGVAIGTAGVATTGTRSSAATSGYGAGGYGADGYGSSSTDSDTMPVVSTAASTDVTTAAATLNGELSTLGGADTATVYFEYRTVDETATMTTVSQELSSPDTFSKTVSGLQQETDYEARAVVEASDGDTAQGGWQRFTTESQSSGAAPVLHTFDVSEAGSPNPHADITVKWGVRDEDGDLESVLIQVHEESGQVVDASRRTIAGSTADDVDYFQIKKARNRQFDVSIRVADAAGNVTDATETVTEGSRKRK